MEKTLGLTKNTAAAFSYILLFVSGLFFFLISKDSYVRFHALQSMITFVTLPALLWIFSLVPFLSTLSSLVGLLTFCLWLLLIYKAHNGETWELPIVGELARKAVKL